MRYEVISYDVWGNARDGYEVNQAFHTGEFVEVDPYAEHHTFFRSLKKQGAISSYAGMKVDEIGDETCLYVVRERDMKPLFELRRVEQ